MNNTACNDSVEPGNLHSASWYRSGYCQYNAGRNRIHTCERGYPELKFYTAGYDGCVVNFQTSNQSRTCGTIFANRRIASCGTADFGGLVPLVPQNPITSTVVEVAKPEYAYYGTLEYYVGLGCNNSQLFQLNTRRVDFCDSQAAYSLKYVCTDFGLREYIYVSNTSCTGPYAYKDYSSVRKTLLASCVSFCPLTHSFVGLHLLIFGTTTQCPRLLLYGAVSAFRIARGCNFIPLRHFEPILQQELLRGASV
jgi:hypothetical protein